YLSRKCGVCSRTNRSHVLLAICVSGNAAAGQSFRFFDPTAAHRLVQVRVRLEELELRRDKRELGDKQRLFRGGNLQIDGRALLIAQLCQVAEAPQGLDVLRLLVAYPSELHPIDERVLHVLETADDGLFVGVERLSLQRFGLRDLTADPTSIENGLQHTSSIGPRSGRSFQQIRELDAFQAE